MKYLMFSLLAVLVACQKPVAEESVAHEITIDEIPPEIRIPTGLWDQIAGHAEKPAHGTEGGGHGEAKPEEGGHGGNAESTADDSSGAGALFIPIDVILTEKNPGVLKESSMKIHLPRGGDSIDLAPLMGSKEGSFYVRFAFSEKEDPGKDVQAWFVSKARKRKLDDEIWGAGCGHFFKITKAFQKQMAGPGLKVNTTRNRHLSVLGGHFVFSARKAGQVFLAQVTLKDSRFENLYCEAL